MAYRHNGMTKQHSWPRIPHDLPDPLALFRAVAMDLTPIAGRLEFLKRANLQALQSVRQQFLAIATKPRDRTMMALTVKAHHRRDGRLFASNSWCRNTGLDRSFLAVHRVAHFAPSVNQFKHSVAFSSLPHNRSLFAVLSRSTGRVFLRSPQEARPCRTCCADMTTATKTNGKTPGIPEDPVLRHLIIISGVPNATLGHLPCEVSKVVRRPAQRASHAITDIGIAPIEDRFEQVVQEPDIFIGRT